MSKKKIIVLSVLLCILIAIAVLVIWQWNNVQAIIQFIRHDETTLEAMLVENEKEIEKVLEQYPELEVTPLDDETKQKLQEGALTEDEVVAILTQPKENTTTGKTPQQNNQTTQKPTSEQKNPGATKSVEEANEEIAQLVARVYVVQADFLNRLAGIESRARAEFHSLPKNQQTADRKVAIGKSYVSEMSALEAECDGEISAIVSKVRKLLKESGQNTALADTIQSTYEQEKSLKKAYYMDRYL